MPKYFFIGLGVKNEHPPLADVNDEQQRPMEKDNGSWAELFIFHFSTKTARTLITIHLKYIFGDDQNFVISLFYFIYLSSEDRRFVNQD